MSETDIAADAIEEDTLVMPEYDAVLDDVISEIAPEAEIVDSVESDNIYPACKHDYIRSPVGSRYQVYDSVALNVANITTILNILNGIIKIILEDSHSFF